MLYIVMLPIIAIKRSFFHSRLDHWIKRDSWKGPCLSEKNWARILVQVTIYRRLLVGRDGHLDQSEAYDMS